MMKLKILLKDKEALDLELTERDAGRRLIITAEIQNN